MNRRVGSGEQGDTERELTASAWVEKEFAPDARE